MLTSGVRGGTGATRGPEASGTGGGGRQYGRRTSPSSPGSLSNDAIRGLSKRHASGGMGELLCLPHIVRISRLARPPRSLSAVAQILRASAPRAAEESGAAVVARCAVGLRVAPFLQQQARQALRRAECGLIIRCTVWPPSGRGRITCDARSTCLLEMPPRQTLLSRKTGGKTGAGAVQAACAAPSCSWKPFSASRSKGSACMCRPISSRAVAKLLVAPKVATCVWPSSCRQTWRSSSYSGAAWCRRTDKRRRGK